VESPSLQRSAPPTSSSTAATAVGNRHEHSELDVDGLRERVVDQWVANQDRRLIRWLPLIVVVLTQIQASLAVNALTVSMAGITTDLNTAATSVATAITAGTFAMAAFILLGAKIGARFGTRSVFQIAVAIHAAAMAIVALSVTPAMLFIGKAGSGAVIALIAPRSRSSSRRTTTASGRRRPSASSQPRSRGLIRPPHLAVLTQPLIVCGRSDQCTRSFECVAWALPKEEPMPNIEHIALYVADLDRACAFYETYFGGVAGSGYHNPATGLRTYFIGFDGGARLELMSRAELDDAGGRVAQGFNHVAFSVGSASEVDALTTRLGRDRYPALSGPRTTGDGYYESVVPDPEGNLVEITA